MYKVQVANAPVSERIRNIIMIREKLLLNTKKATDLYNGLLNPERCPDIDEMTIKSLEEIGWNISKSAVNKSLKRFISQEANIWYNNLSDKEREYIAYFQRMMIPVA